MHHRTPLLALALVAAAVSLSAQAPARTPDWTSLEPEMLTHFQSLVRLDTTDPPGNEQPAVDYLKQVLEKEGIPVQLFTLENQRPNLVARLKGNGSKRPLLLMSHTDVVNVDPAKWTHGPFSAARDGGYIYGRGTVDDKDNLASALMVMLLLKRLNIPLDRDVIFLAEAGEEGTTRVGIDFMVKQHFPDVEAEYCLAEGGRVSREGGQVRFAAVQTTEKIPRAIELTARGVSGHASVPLQSNPLVHLGGAITRLAEWQAPISLNETTGTYFRRLAQISAPEAAARYRDVLDPSKVAAVDRYFQANEPAHAAMLHTTLSPTLIGAGYRLNVIPSDAKATIDIRMLPDEDPAAMLALVRGVVNDPAVEVRFVARDERPAGSTPLNTEAFKAIEAAVTKEYGTVTVPTMSTGATDMAYLRGRGVQCYGIGPATDVEDGAKGFGAHSDQERILESELQRFLRFNWEVVHALVRTR